MKLYTPFQAFIGTLAFIAAFAFASNAYPASQREIEQLAAQKKLLQAMIDAQNRIIAQQKARQAEAQRLAQEKLKQQQQALLAKQVLAAKPAPISIKPAPTVVVTPAPKPAPLVVVTPAPKPAPIVAVAPTPKPVPAPVAPPSNRGKTYRVGVLQVVPPEFNLDNLKLCLFRDDYWKTGQGSVPSKLAPDCQKTFSAAYGKMRSYSFKDLVLGRQSHTLIPDITTFDHGTKNESATQKVFSIHHLGEYWEGLLRKHGLENRDTVLGVNPHFELDVLDPIAAPYTGTVGSQPEAKVFFAQVASQNKIDLTRYDFVVAIAYYDAEKILVDANGVQSNPRAPFRSFASGKYGYTAFPLTASTVLFNDAFLTLAHEFGHQAFGLGDLYEGFGLKVPEGLPDPKGGFQKQGCLMVGKMGDGRLTPNGKAMQGYETRHMPAETARAHGIGRFHSETPENFGLCVDDIVRILRGKENPDCTVQEFYAGKCRDCTSENYLSCARIK